MDAHKAFQQLTTNPRDFLAWYPVNTAGSNGVHAPGAANVHQFQMYKQNPVSEGTIPSKKVGHYGAMRPSLFGEREVSSFKISDLPAPGTATQHTFNALSVPMHNYNAVTVAALDHYLLDGTGDGLMITGQLSGCTFAWRVAGNDLMCTHIRPVGTTPTQLQNALRTNGRFTAAPVSPLYTFGMDDYGPYANVIGVRKNGQWSLYAQNSTDRLMTITAAWQIYPAPVVPL